MAAIRIGHARGPEISGVNGQPGDQTGREVCISNWYDGGWGFLAFHPDPAVRERHARAIEAVCANQNVGYGQFGVTADRNSMFREAVKVGLDFSRITTPCNTDCSALQNAAAVASGSGAKYGANGWTTGTMEGELRALGYMVDKAPEHLTNPDFAVRGSVLVRHNSGADGHTVCVLDDGPRAAETLAAGNIEAPAQDVPMRKPAGGGRTYQVKWGDTLGQIAIDLLGDYNRWHEIAELNGIDGDKIYAGQVLKLPEA